MPKISEKGAIMPASAIRKLVPYAEAVKKKGIKVYHLNIGQPDIATPQVALDAVKSYDAKVIEYSHSAGNESYRKGLVEYYKSIGIELDYASEIVVTTGGSEAIIIAFMVCFNPGDEIIIPEPYYTNYNSFAAMNGVTIKPIRTTIETNFALPSIEEFEKVITPKTKGIMVCNPNNPTGYLYTEEELEQLRKLVLKYDLYLFSDEVYREFCYGGRKHHSAMHLKGIENNVVLFDSTSKRYSMCGIRVGAIISHNKEVMSAALRFGQARLCPPAYGQVAAEAALKTPKTYFDEVYQEYVARRDYIVGALNKIDGVICPDPKGAFYTVVQLPVDDTDKFCQWMLEEFSYENQTVMMAPATGFYSKPELGKHQVRIAYVLKIEDLKNAVKCLEEGLKVYPGRLK